MVQWEFKSVLYLLTKSITPHFYLGLLPLLLRSLFGERAPPQ